MISDLVEASFIKTLATRTTDNLGLELQRLQANDETAKEGAGAAGITAAEAAAVHAELERWQRDLAAIDIPTEQQEPVIIPRSAIPSLLQSAYEEFFRTAHAFDAEPAVQGLAPSQVPATEDTLDDTTREFFRDNRAYLGGRYATRFAERDLRFLTWGLTSKIATRIAGGRRYFTMRPPAPVKIENRARVLLVGDWGSGVPRAIQLGKVMHQAVLSGIAEGRQCHVVHLGDVYYTGQRAEYDRRFLIPWPVKENQADTVGSWCLNGNHDMYSGGYDYFDHLLVDRRFAQQERSSFFCLENDDWRILGLDSAYDDADLYGPQVNWLEATLKREPRKKGLLLTHHQLFSEWEGKSTKMLDKVRPVLDQKLVTAWFWGHEHRCAAYEERFGVKYPRLAGHGGVPVWASTKPTPPHVIDEFRESFPAFLNERFARFGFVQLDFEGPRILVSYLREQGTAHRTEVLE